MSALCDMALAVGLTLSGACQTATAPHDPMPADDPKAWAYKPAEPPPPAPPPPTPAFPPVVIQREVIREVPAAPPAAAPQSLGPDEYEAAIRQSYQSRSKPLTTWPSIAIPVDYAPESVPSLPGVTPLDMGATIGAGGTSRYKEKSITSTGPVDNERIVTTDRYIPGILETGVNTQLDGASGGPVVIQTTRDVFGYHGRDILIPKGSRLVCAFKSLDKVGASRAPMRCSRVLLGGSRAEIFGMKANVTDVQGALGVSGEVDDRFFERYGTAFILAGVSAAVTSVNNGSSSASTNLSTGQQTISSNGLSSGSQALAQQLGEITAATLKQTLNLTPILKIAQGTRIIIRPDTDWYIAPASAVASASTTGEPQ